MVIKLQILLWATTLLLPTGAAGQNFFKQTFGFEGGFNQAHDVCETTDQGYMICGSAGGANLSNGDALLIRCDSVGQALWMKTFGTPATEELRCILRSGNQYFAAGLQNRPTQGGFDVWLISFDEQGNLLWQKNFGGADWDLVHDLAITPSGQLLLCGESFSTQFPLGSAWVIKTDLQGNMLSEDLYPADGRSAWLSCATYADGSYLLAGFAEQNQRENARLMHCNANGQVLFDSIYDYDSRSRFVGVDTASNHQSGIVGWYDTASGDRRLLFPFANAQGQLTNDLRQGTDGAAILPHSITSIGADAFAFSTLYNPFGSDYALAFVSYATMYLKCNQGFEADKNSMAGGIIYDSRNGIVQCGSTLGFGPGQSSAFLMRLSTDCESVSTVAVNLQSVSDAQMHIYPNPAKDWLQLPLADEYYFFDLWGRNHAVTVDALGRTNLTSLAAGMYLVKWRQKGQVFHQRLLIAH